MLNKPYIYSDIESAFMKTLTFIVERAEEGGFNARAIGEPIFTQAETLEEVRTNLADAIECHYDTPDFPMFALKFVDNK